jgi:hypothetical protein
MTAQSDRRDRWRFAWRVGVITFIVLSIAAAIAGWVLTQFDDQYEASGVAERMFIGVFAGAFGALLLTPVSAIVSLIVGVGASIWRRGKTASQRGL